MLRSAFLPGRRAKQRKRLADYLILLMEELINSFKSRSITSIRVLSILTALWIAVMLNSGFCFNTSSSTAVRTRSDKLTNRPSRQICLKMRKFSSEIRQLIIRVLGSNGKRLLPSDNGLLSYLLRERIIGCHREACRNVSCSYRARCERRDARSSIRHCKAVL